MNHKIRIVLSLCVAIGWMSATAHAEVSASERAKRLSRYESMLNSTPGAREAVAKERSPKAELEKPTTTKRLAVEVEAAHAKEQVQRLLPPVPRPLSNMVSKKVAGLEKTNTFLQKAVVPRHPVNRTVKSDVRVALPALPVSSASPGRTITEATKSQALATPSVAPPSGVSQSVALPVVTPAAAEPILKVLPAIEDLDGEVDSIAAVEAAAFKALPVISESVQSVGEPNEPEVRASTAKAIKAVEEAAEEAVSEVQELAVDASETLPIANVRPPVPTVEVPRVAMIPQDAESIVVEATDAVADASAVDSGILSDTVFEAESVLDASSTIVSPAPVAYANPWIESGAQQYEMNVSQPPLLFSHDVNPVCGDNCSDWPCDVCGMTYCCCSKPCWRVRADGVFLHRSRADGFAEALINCNCATPTVYQPDSLSMDFHGAPRMTIIRDNQCGGLDLEGNYYIVDHWTGTQTLDGPVVALGTDLGDGSADVRYESKLQNAELNLFKDVTNWSQFMLGFRWLELDEHASVIGSGTLVPAFDQRVDVTNSLLGGQIGWRKTIWDAGGFVTANVTTKGGLFHNSIRRRTTGFGTSPLEKDVLSYVGEVDISMNCEITQCWSVNAGYQFMWIGNVAEAPDQFFSPDAIFDEATVFLHGMRIGLTKTF